jgi:uncharacterized protein YndB with AHSA1/START domain
LVAHPVEDAVVAQQIEREVLIDAPVDVVWSVVTEPEHISGWFSDTVELELRPGGALVLRWEGSYTVQGRVERVEPPHFFSFQWVVGNGSELAEGNSTLVEFSLVPEGERTRLKVVESGFRELALDEDVRRERVDGHREGWIKELGELVEYAERLGR